ncbi:MAG: hypothetical protein KA035_00345 [Candidatus Levybacteria bacterium]|nr:hypothetical protein [Candidatus Levybacteria bacterium]
MKKKYMVLLVDRNRASMFALMDDVVSKKEVLKSDDTPQKVKHGDDTWDAQNKIFRHIEDHLHRHLQKVGSYAQVFAKENHITEIIIGGHRPLFAKVKKNLPPSLSKKVKGTFVTELKVSFGEILKRAKKCIDIIEREEEVRRYEKNFTHKE